VSSYFSSGDAFLAFIFSIHQMQKQRIIEFANIPTKSFSFKHFTIFHPLKRVI
jgi:hypothetical protein